MPTNSTTVMSVTDEFFKEFSASSVSLNLNSVLYKALASSNEAFNDPDYRTEMVYTFNSVTEFIKKIAILSGNSVLIE